MAVHAPPIHHRGPAAGALDAIERLFKPRPPVEHVGLRRLTAEDILKFDYFRDLTAEEAERLARLVRITIADPGQQVVADGEAGGSMYLLVEGEVEVSKKLYVKGVEGFQVGHRALSHRQGPYAFGEMALFDVNGRRSSTVTAVNECLLGELRHDDFLALAEADTHLGLSVIRAVARKLSNDLHAANEDVLNLTTAFSFALERWSAMKLMNGNEEGK